MSINEVLNGKKVKWMDAPGDKRDIAISCRVRLARNITGIPFPHMLNTTVGVSVLEQIKEARSKSTGGILPAMELVALDQMNAIDRQVLAEKHLISPVHAKSDSPARGIMINQDGS